MIAEVLRRCLGGTSSKTPPKTPHPGLLGPDGCPSGSPEAAAAALLDRLGGSSSSADLSSCVGAIDALVRIEGVLGWLPGGSPSTPPTDRVLHRLVCRASELSLPAPGPTEPTERWAAWAWRDTGCTVAHSLLAGTASRIWLGPSLLRWDWGTHTLLSNEHSEGLTLDTARVDGLRFCALQSGAGQHRRLEARKARLSIKLTGQTPPTTRWTLGWPAELIDGQLLATSASRTLKGKLDPSWRWALSGSTLLGEGSGPMTCRFELV